MIWACVGLTVLWLGSLKDDQLVPLTSLIALLSWAAYAFFWFVK